jgi:hypothetical protein
MDTSDRLFRGRSPERRGEMRRSYLWIVLRAALLMLIVAGAFLLLAWIPGRMTGGGSILTEDGMRVTHGFELYCQYEKPD